MDRGPITTVHSICDGGKLRPDRNNVALAALAEPIRSGRSDFCIFQLLFFITSSELLQNFLFSTDGRGLQGLAAQLHTRCQWVVRHKGQRYPK